MRGDDPRGRWAEVERWLTVAEDDRMAVNACMMAAAPLRTIAAFHCQQAIEKLLKGFLVLATTRFRKTHSLAQLGAAPRRSLPRLPEPSRRVTNGRCGLPPIAIHGRKARPSGNPMMKNCAALW